MKNILMSFYSSNDQYHAKKEQMAWTATTVFLTFSGVLINWILKLDLGQLNVSAIYTRNVIIICSIFIFLSVTSFVYMQFSMRWISSDIATILKKLLFNFEDDKILEKMNNSFTLDKKRPYVYFPDNIQKEFDKLVSKRCFRSFSLSFISIMLIFGIFSNKIDSRYKTEIPSYIAMIIAFIIQIIVTAKVFT